MTMKAICSCAPWHWKPTLHAISVLPSDDEPVKIKSAASRMIDSLLADLERTFPRGRTVDPIVQRYIDARNGGGL